MISKISIKKSLLILLAFIFVFTSVSGILYATNKYNIIIAKGRKIHVNEFLTYFNRERQIFYSNAIQQNKDFDLKELDTPKFLNYAMKKITYSVLLEEEVKYYNIEEPQNIVLKKIINEPYFASKDGKFDNLKLTSYLKDVKLSEGEFIEAIQRDDERNFLSFIFNSFPTVNNTVKQNILNYKNAGKNIVVYTKYLKDFPQFKLKKIEEKEIEDYYNLNKQLFANQEKRKIDYIEFEKLDEKKINELNDAILTVKDLNSLVTANKAKVKTMNLAIEKDTFNSMFGTANDEFFDNGKVGEMSKVIEYKNKFYICMIKEVQHEHVKTLEEAKNEIVSILQNEQKLELAKQETEKMLAQFKDKKFNKQVVLNNGFKAQNRLVSRYVISRTNLIKDVFTLKENDLTNVYKQDDRVYFALVGKDQEIDPKDANYLTKDTLDLNMTRSLSSSFRNTYFNYLENNKYKVKINQKLLQYFQPQK